jgi:type IV secretory pathway VirJ component
LLLVLALAFLNRELRTYHYRQIADAVLAVSRHRIEVALCVHGAEEPRSACRDAPVGLMRVVARQGKHHFDNDYRGLGELVWSAVP